MQRVGVVVEGIVDARVAEKVLLATGHVLDPARRVVKRGKSEVDPMVARLNRVAQHGPWLILRDSDHDEGDCPARLRSTLLSEPLALELSLRLPVRTVESWLLADREAFSQHFKVSRDRLPLAPDEQERPKRTLVAACGKSSSRGVRQGMVGRDEH